MYTTGWKVRDTNPVTARDFSFIYHIQTCPGAHTASCSIGVGSFSPGVKRSRREADQSHTLPPKLRMQYDETWVLTYSVMVMYLNYNARSDVTVDNRASVGS